MDDLHRFSMICLGVLNLATFIVYGWDKFSAGQGWRRVPEKILLLLAFFGGTPGALAAMALFRHKTRHLKFRYGVPLMIIMQIALLVYIHIK